MFVQRNTEAFGVAILAVEKQYVLYIYIYSECASVALFIQHAKRMCLKSLLYFSKLSRKGYDFQKSY